MTPYQRLEILQVFTDLLVRTESGITRNKERFKHQQQVSKFPLTSLCFVCKDLAYIRHHVIQLQHGGLSVRGNIVSLCLYCHAEVHPWLKYEQQFSKPPIDWNLPDSNPFKPYLCSSTGQRNFCDWLFSQRKQNSQTGKFAALAYEDPDFPRHARHLWVFLKYYVLDDEKRSEIKKIHATWRKIF